MTTDPKPWHRDLHTWAALLLISPVVGYFVFLGIRQVQRVFDLSKSDWAAWVQAIGSVAAIIVTALLVNRQHTLERRLQRDAEIAKHRNQLRVAAWAGRSLADFCKRVEQWLPDAEESRVRSASRAMSGELAALQAACARLDLTARGGEAAEHIAVLGATIGTMLEHARNIHDHAYADANGRPQFVRYVERRISQIEHATAAIGRKLERLPRDQEEDDSFAEVEFSMALRDAKEWY